MTTTSDSEDTVTFKRTHFYSVLVVLAFAVGILTGYVAWGRSSIQSQTVVNDQPAVQAPAAQVPMATQPPQFTRYDIPADGFPGIGPEDAPIVIVEFSDFQCPFCKRFYDETYQQLLAAYPDKIRFVYRHLPLTSIHPEAFPAAEASMCANEQNAFSEYHDKIFENQDKLGRELYTQIANDLNLDNVAFEDCLNTGKYKDLIQQDSDFALNLGVQSTPTFFINGLALVGAQPLEAFKQLIDKELAGEIPK
ncbi:Disulfide bond formation protein D [Anaerolineales bacterium]|nr:Disulfide bond formation protein D [Anaerolineales bacterium]